MAGVDNWLNGPRKNKRIVTMINIGIEKYQGLVYEIDGDRGRPVWPTPVITTAKFRYSSDGTLQAESACNVFGYRFREDSYDPIARIRRGRFYCADGSSQPKGCVVSPHPAVPIESTARDIHVHPKSLEVFYGQPIWHKYISGKRELPLVLLGVDERFTIWTIIDVEAIMTGEDLVTLKSRSSFGILPQIIEAEVPAAFKTKLAETLAVFIDEVHRAAPTSVIDRARDAATQALLAYFDLKGSAAQDLGELIKRLHKEKRVVAANAASIIARLHARAKPSEQEKRVLRSIRERDADLAAQCLGALLCEIGFAEWI